MTKRAQRKPRRAFCTVAAYNYFARIEALGASISRHHPDVPLLALGVDTWHALMKSTYRPKNFKLVDFWQLQNFALGREFPLSLPYMLFRYDVMEGSTSAKPIFFEYLFHELGFDEVIFLDPDTYLFSSLDQIWCDLEKYNLVLTPHQLQLGRSKDAVSHERIALRYGVFNLGFLGMRAHSDVFDFLTWWRHRLFDFCYRRTEDGLFTDQKWIDFAQVQVPNTQICRDAGVNVAAWNLHERPISIDARGALKAGGDRLKLFHFTSYDPSQPEKIGSKTHMTLDHFSNLRPIFSRYHAELMALGQANLQDQEYFLDFFENGVRPPIEARQHLQSRNLSDRFKNPFETRTGDNFFNSLFRMTELGLPGLLDLLWIYRTDLARAYPRTRAGANELALWYKLQGRVELAWEPRVFRLVDIQLGFHRQSEVEI